MAERTEVMSSGNVQQSDRVQSVYAQWFRQEDFFVGAAAGGTAGCLSAFYVRLPMAQVRRPFLSTRWLRRAFESCLRCGFAHLVGA